MAHYQHPLRYATEPERAAFSYPREQGIMRVRHGRWGIDVGHRLVAKNPFLIGDFMVMQGDEYRVVERFKDEGKFKLRCVRDNRISVEATIQEIDVRFYAVPGDETTHRPFSPLYAKMQGKPEYNKPSKDEEEEEDPKKKKK